MDVALASLLNLYTFSTGRRLFALQQVHKIAAATGFTALKAHVAAAIKHDQTTRDLDFKWEGTPVTPEGSGEVRRVDTLVDRTLSAIRDGAESQAAAATPGDGIAEKVTGFLREIFPAGVQAITGMTFVEELAAVDGIVHKLEGELAPVVEELGLRRQAKRLADLAKEYRKAQEAPRAAGLEFGTVRAARAQGQENLLQAVAMILGKHYKNTPDEIAARANLLGPIVAQNEAIRLYLRSRRAVEDVDPETGEVAPGAPPSGPAPEGGEGTPV
jgi:hypothetical protein